MISIVVAMDKNRVIGKNNQLPWHLPADLAFFKKVTMGKAIVMGRKTYESIGRPLPGRENIILTKNREYQTEGCTIIHSIDDVFDIEKIANGEVCVIGGAEIFKEVLTSTDRLYITEIDHEFEGDTYFPLVRESDWTLISKEKGPKDEKNPYDYYFAIYERILS
ncbi:dihydrofolate reductase [Schinkia azotoformans]|uniref:Dihydrofolate reductase n=1 Tax=Schinkia azotoformans LMG 9581 TaxID=1131731 RepID=K6D741_SCHAZ|nr:dihydrofolate reductase [Schinkia azotoformans]EKN68347.1 dihydrofolate reductase [Schinkia azotoformans LMG 9581]MEC1638539.1 dihydrofolate reductase [Schinkia azotoformans]MEC1722743.1 dihydrofolate reductase [Schinkia azotoformans]MEC1946026.1 dihydrofolate reductase [Schinkia azotoformans]MED4351529.1 dihydrofolate reductase [Schinkia azotoformans]